MLRGCADAKPACWKVPNLTARSVRVGEVPETVGVRVIDRRKGARVPALDGSAGDLDWSPLLRRPYRLTVKLLALLVPTVVVTSTVCLPNLAFAGTLHLILVSLQETYLVHFVVPNFT